MLLPWQAKVRGVSQQKRHVFVGMDTTAGTYALLKSIVPGDATVAAKLRAAGAILLGKPNLVIIVYLYVHAMPSC